jgi:Fic family protein
MISEGGERQLASNRYGTLKINLSGESAYISFAPMPLPPNPAIELADMVNLLVATNKQLALLNGLSAYIPNINLFVSMYVRKEALMSSQIEGMQATLEDVLDPLLDENANRNVAAVINYVRATEFAIERQSELPLCNRLIKETHAVLMDGIRGQKKNPGEFRRSQNWVSGQGSTLKNARYIPPNVEDMTEAMSDLEKYLNAEDGLDALIRVALIHY